MACYQRWVADKPVGLGAVCCNCGERRRAVLQQFELHALWVVLCRNCAALAGALAPMPRSVDGLRLRLMRERRWGDRRAEAVTGTRPPRSGQERRRTDRRVNVREEMLDPSDLVMEIELEADYASDAESHEPDDVPITAVHPRVDASEL